MPTQLCLTLRGHSWIYTYLVCFVATSQNYTPKIHNLNSKKEKSMYVDDILQL